MAHWPETPSGLGASLLVSSSDMTGANTQHVTGVGCDECPVSSLIGMFMCTAAELKGDPTVEAWGSGAAAGLAAIQRYGGAKPGDRTMLDALTPAVSLYQQKLSDGECSYKGCTPCDVVECTCLILSCINIQRSCCPRPSLLGI